MCLSLIEREGEYVRCHDYVLPGGGRGRGRGGQKEVRGGEPGGLKSTSEILRKRKKRDFQDTMRNIKLQRKSGEGGGRGRGHRGRTGGRGRGRQS